MLRWAGVIAKLTCRALRAAKSFAMTSTLRAVLLFSAVAAAFTALMSLMFRGWMPDPGILIGLVAVATTSCVLLRLEHEKHDEEGDYEDEE